MFLAIDAGNSDIVFGFHEADQWQHTFRIATFPRPAARDIEMKLRLFLLENTLKISQVNQVAFCSVVPVLNETVVQTIEHLFDCEVLMIDSRRYKNLAVSTSNPMEMGTDLMANAVAAFDRYKSACLVVDFGTALTFTAMNDGGEIIGVNIVPGIRTAIKSLATNTAQLPEIKLEIPQVVLGTNTVESIQAGILYGYTGLVENMIDRIKQSLPYSIKVMATGGFSTILTPLAKTFDDIDVLLTLKGIKLISDATDIKQTLQ